jgi:hypothetical protein
MPARDSVGDADSRIMGVVHMHSWIAGRPHANKALMPFSVPPYPATSAIVDDGRGMKQNPATCKV